MPSAANSHVIWPRSAQRAITRGTIGANNDGTRSHCITTAPSPSFALLALVASSETLAFLHPPCTARYRSRCASLRAALLQVRHAPCARSQATGARTFCHGWRTTATTVARVRNSHPHPRQHCGSSCNEITCCFVETESKRALSFCSVRFHSIRNNICMQRPREEKKIGIRLQRSRILTQ